MKKNKLKNEYMRNYFLNNPLKNNYHCHNKQRKRKNIPKITFEEYIEYRTWSKRDSLDRVKSGIISNIELWEKYKKDKKLKFGKI